MVGLTDIQLPRLFQAWDKEVRDTVTGETSLGLGASSDSAFVPDFTT
jgi:hypothetical protein